MDHLQEPLVRQLAAARERTAGTRPSGAATPLHPRRSSEGATAQPTLSTVTSHSRSGILLGAVDSTRGEERPEAVDSQPREVVAILGAGSRAAAGEGRGPAGNQATQPPAHCILLIRNSFYSFNIIVSV
jgi:hypothetical protein